MADTAYPDMETINIRPNSASDAPRGQQTIPDKTRQTPGSGKLSRQDITSLIKQEMPGLSTAGVEGVVRNVIRESGGDPRVEGDKSQKTGEFTSGGLFQHHDTRWNDLKSFAKQQGLDWQDPVAQVRFSASELKKNYPSLLKQLTTAEDPADAEDAFKRVFERPASIMWQNNSPRLASDTHKYSDYAMNEHVGRKDTDLVYMAPQDYLDLSPDLEAKPFESPSGKALHDSVVGRGEPVESIPTLDMEVQGNTGKVVDQDGRHRALLAQQQGIDAIPVAMRKSGDGTPTEVEGMTGKVLPNDFRPVADVKKKDPSLWTRAVQAIIPSAEAAEPIDPYAQYSKVVDDHQQPQAQPQAAAPDPYGQYAHVVDDQGGQQPAPPAPANGMVASALNGVSKGIGDTVYGAQELLGKGLEASAGIMAPLTRAVGADPEHGIVQRAGEYLVGDARARQAAEQAKIAPDQAANPISTGLGSTVGGFLMPGGIAGKIGGNALRIAGIGGALGGLLKPEGDDSNYWTKKSEEAGIGAAAGLVGNAVASRAASALAPVLRDKVRTLMSEGIELTPGMVKGGAAKAAEDKLSSMPILGDAIVAARQRAYQDFNRAAWNRVLEPLGEKVPDTVKMGRDAMDYVGKRLSDEYGQILPNLKLTSIQNDPAWAQDMADAVTKARGSLPDSEFATFEKIVRSQLEQKLGPAGSSIDGDLINGIDSQLGTEVRGYKGSGEHDKRKLGQALEDVQESFRDLLERQNPTQKDALQKVRRGYANYVRVGKAASSQGSGTTEGIFSPAQLNAAVRSEDSTARKMGYGKGKALLQDLSDAAQAVLPSHYPDSGTAGRNMIGTMASAVGLGSAGGMLGGTGATTGGLGAAITTLGALGAASLPYRAPISKAANAALGILAQTPGPTRNALVQALRRGVPLMAAPNLGHAAAGVVPMIPPNSQVQQ